MFTLIENGPEATPVDLKASANSFAQHLYSEVVADADGDVIMSPFSAQTILAEALQGAGGVTLQQMIKGLKFDGSSTTAIAESYRVALGPLQTSTMLKTGNKIYLQQGYTIRPTFNQIATNNFYSTAQNLNFALNVDAANTINAWVESQTNNTIKNLIPATALNADTRMVLVNAIYFKGNWEKQFNPDHTYPQDFYTNSQTINQIDTMYLSVSTNK